LMCRLPLFRAISGIAHSKSNIRYGIKTGSCNNNQSRYALGHESSLITTTTTTTTTTTSIRHFSSSSDENNMEDVNTERRSPYIVLKLKTSATKEDIKSSFRKVRRGIIGLYSVNVALPHSILLYVILYPLYERIITWIKTLGN